MLGRIDFVLDDNDVVRKVDQDVDTSPFASHINMTEVHQIGVEESASLRPAIGKNIA